MAKPTRGETYNAYLDAEIAAGRAVPDAIEPDDDERCCEHDGGMHLSSERPDLFTCFAVIGGDGEQDIICGCVTDANGKRLTEDEYEDRMTL